jgi:hypothetical protein
MPKPLPADGVRKQPLTTRWTVTDRAALEAEVARVNAETGVDVPLAKLLEVSTARFLTLSPATRTKLLTG